MKKLAFTLLSICGIIYLTYLLQNNQLVKAIQFLIAVMIALAIVTLIILIINDKK